MSASMKRRPGEDKNDANQAKQKQRQKPKSKQQKPPPKVALPYPPTRLPRLADANHAELSTLLQTVIPSFSQQPRADKDKSDQIHTKKRKRDSDPVLDSALTDAVADHTSDSETVDRQHKKLSSRRIIIGINAVTAHLEYLAQVGLAQQRRQYAPPSTTNDSMSTERDEQSLQKAPEHVALVLVPTRDLPIESSKHLMYAHLPVLCATASLAHPDLSATRIVSVNESVERSMTQSVGLARIGALAVLHQQNEDAGGEALDGLVDFVRALLDPVEVPWLEIARKGAWVGQKDDR